MLLNITLAAFIMLLTTIIHTGGMMLIMNIGKKYTSLLKKKRHILLISVSVLLMFIVSFLEILVWAVTFILLDEISNIEEALYFSTVTFTTLGYGDIVLDARWRLLASFEAINGIIMFGWTTAIIIAVVHWTYGNEKLDN